MMNCCVHQKSIDRKKEKKKGKGIQLILFISEILKYPIIYLFI